MDLKNKVILHTARVIESIKMGKAKYPCLDGINRDKQIDDYLRMEKEVQKLESSIKALASRRDDYLQKMSYLDSSYLGGIGLVALDKERRRREVETKKSKSAR